MQITARPRRQTGPREVVVVVDADAARELGRRLLAMAEEVAGAPPVDPRAAAARAGQLEARARGVHIGRPITVPDAVIRRLVALRAEGLSHAQVAERMNRGRTKPARGDRWTRDMVRDLLLRRGGEA